MRARSEPVQVVPLPDDDGEPASGGASSTSGRQGLYLALAGRDEVDVAPGDVGSVTLRIRNTGSLVERVEIGVHGVPASWISIDSAMVNLDVNVELTALVRIAPPRHFSTRTGRFPTDIVAWSSSDPTVRCTIKLYVTVSPFRDGSLSLTPTVEQGRASAHFTASVVNTGNTVLRGVIETSEPKNALRFVRQPTEVTAPPGTTVSVAIEAIARRRLWIGAPRSHVFEVRLATPGLPVPPTTATYTQLSRLPRWAPKAIALVVILGLVAGVLALRQAYQQRARAVPAVIGLTVEEARILLDDDGFELAVDRGPDYDHAEGIVFDQVPPEGEKAKPDTSVRLKVSDGKPEREVPDVRGKDQAEAEADLAAAELQAQVAGEQASDTVAAGMVVDQDPAPQAIVEGRSVVRLTLSTGPPTVAVPRLEGLSQADATSLMVQLDLALEVVEPIPPGPWLVVDQQPDPGVEVPRGATVTVAVIALPTS